MNRKARFIGAWVTSTLFEQIEEFIRNQGYMSKSEFLRALIRQALDKND
jgi:metal-responsive CopG/Arc/MetJ family transcriptional regulator